MKGALPALLLILLLAQTPLVLAEPPAADLFSQLKAFAGTWSGVNSAGASVTVSFRETSAGSALLSEAHVSGHGEMISVFHLDRDRLLLTHYCSAGNQPRLTGHSSPGGRSIAFRFLDATNLSSPDDGHMSRVVISFLDADHHTETWVYRDHGKEITEVCDLRRTKPGPPATKERQK
ncbi:MAG: hypothetical protein U0Q16_24390 [Bryobacteraceae bacterium]